MSYEAIEFANNEWDVWQEGVGRIVFMVSEDIAKRITAALNRDKLFAEMARLSKDVANPGCSNITIDQHHKAHACKKCPACRAKEILAKLRAAREIKP